MEEDALLSGGELPSGPWRLTPTHRNMWLTTEDSVDQVTPPPGEVQCIHVLLYRHENCLQNGRILTFSFSL